MTYCRMGTRLTRDAVPYEWTYQGADKPKVERLTMALKFNEEDVICVIEKLAFRWETKTKRWVHKDLFGLKKLTDEDIDVGYHLFLRRGRVPRRPSISGTATRIGPTTKRGDRWRA